MELPLSALTVVASLCFGDTHQVMKLDPRYVVDTKHTPWSRRSIRYAMHEPEREFRYLSSNSRGMIRQYRVRINISPEMAQARLLPRMPLVLDGCCPAG